MMQIIFLNIFRKRFGFEGWKNFDSDLWKKIRDVSLGKEKKILWNYLRF